MLPAYHARMPTPVLPTKVESTSTMTKQTDAQSPASTPQDNSRLITIRREKLARWRERFEITGYGNRVDGLISLADARALFDEPAHERYEAAKAERKENPEASITDDRPKVIPGVAGRVVQHRAMGKLVFLSLRDWSGDLQVSISKADMPPETFKLASKLDYGDIIVAGGPVGQTQKGEICIWADRLEVHVKSLMPPPEKFHGLTDPELRARHRSIDMYANPKTMETFRQRSQIVSLIRRFMEKQNFLEVETPMMQPKPGGAAARPFITHHNTLDIDLYLRIAPELYLKRLLVGGMPRVFEIGRNFRNEGVDRSHNPEFTAIEAYEAFGNCDTMLDLTESLLHNLATELGEGRTALPFGDIEVDYARPFLRTAYGDLFEEILGFSIEDEAQVRAKGKESGMENSDSKDHWLLVNELYERFCEPTIDPTRPTFITDYPAVISPLTRPHPDRPHLCERWELMVAGMEIGTAYTELNDPDIQRAKFTEQLAGADEEETTFRALDEDFLHALMVGMPPAGGLGLGVDRIVMLMTNQPSIREVILFPLLKPSD